MTASVRACELSPNGPKAWRLRLTLVEVLVRQSDLSQIALEAGFSSHTHFTASFRAHFGVTPSAVAFGATLPRVAASRSFARRRSPEVF